jgi:uncharacterized protein (UPF0216 family)
MSCKTDIQIALTQARKAKHDLMTGKAPRVIVDNNGERVEFNTANINSLNTYIAELETSLARAGTTSVRGPLGFFF